MLRVDMDNNKTYMFARHEYDTYYVDAHAFIVTKGEAWVGYFRLEHLIGFSANDNDKF